MDAGSFPTGTFTLTKPIAIAPLPANAVIKTYTATGNLTLHGHTRVVTFAVSAERVGSSIKISESIPVRFADLGYTGPELWQVGWDLESRCARISARLGGGVVTGGGACRYQMLS
jgi:hypothetical protein